MAVVRQIPVNSIQSVFTALALLACFRMAFVFQIPVNSCQSDFVYTRLLGLFSHGIRVPNRRFGLMLSKFGLMLSRFGLMLSRFGLMLSRFGLGRNGRIPHGGNLISYFSRTALVKGVLIISMMKVVCFHKPEEENGYLSNWYLSDFIADGIKFSSMEQYMMYRKAVCFNDKDTAIKILGTDDVFRIKELGQSASGYDENFWNGIRQIVVYKGLLEKFYQNPELREKLISTGNAVFAECSVSDVIWGIGLSMKSPDRNDQSKWKGQNLLGYALMMAREKMNGEILKK